METDFGKIKKAEEKNLEDILIAEKREWEKMSLSQRFVRKLKNKFIRSHEFRDNGFKIESDRSQRPKIVVYTCIAGNYDRVIEPNFEFKNVDYILFTDEKIKSEKWKVLPIPNNCRQESPVLTNRYVKMHPHEIFGEDYEYSIYIDGNIKVVGDVTPMTYVVKKLGLALHRHSMRDDIRKEVYACISQKKGNKQKLLEQLNDYKRDGFPKRFGMLECNVIVVRLDNDKAREILNDWWKEFIRSGSMRDQISLPYVIWKKGYTIDDIGNLGYNVYRNPKLRKMEHKK